MFREAWGAEAAKKQAEFNDFLQVLLTLEKILILLSKVFSLDPCIFLLPSFLLIDAPFLFILQVLCLVLFVVAIFCLRSFVSSIFLY